MAEPIKEGDLPKKKTTQGLTKMFKEMKGTESATMGLAGVFDALGFLEPLMRPLEVILQIVGSLFGVMAAEILPPLMDALQPIFDMLIELQPVFAELGAQIGKLLAAILPPLIQVFIMLFVAIKPLIPKIMELVAQIVDLIVRVLPLILPIVITIAEVIIAVLKPILDWLGSLSPSELAMTIYVLGLGLAALYGLYTGGPWTAALYGALWAAFMAPLLFMQEGGILTKPTLMVGGEAGKEIVAPLDEFYSRIDEMTNAQAETNSILTAIYEEKKFRHDLRRKL